MSSLSIGHFFFALLHVKMLHSSKLSINTFQHYLIWLLEVNYLVLSAAAKTLIVIPLNLIKRSKVEESKQLLCVPYRTPISIIWLFEACKCCSMSLSILSDLSP